MKKNAVILFVVLISLLFGCEKKENAGFGGNANITLYAKHHGASIDSVTFYVKFNSNDAPSDGMYDVTKSSTIYFPGNSFATIPGLKKGDYYFYAVGWDPSVNATVKGGLPYTIKEESNLNIILSVTE
jgi:hypothetical protein